MPYLIQAKLKDGGFSVVVKTAKDALGSVGIHGEFITAAARWIMEAKL